LLKKVQDCVAIGGQLHFGVEVDIHVEVVGVLVVVIHPSYPECLFPCDPLGDVKTITGCLASPQNGTN